jgi:hypothetical protein
MLIPVPLPDSVDRSTQRTPRLIQAIPMTHLVPAFKSAADDVSTVPPPPSTADPTPHPALDSPAPISTSAAAPTPRSAVDAVPRSAMDAVPNDVSPAPLPLSAVDLGPTTVTPDDASLGAGRVEEEGVCPVLGALCPSMKNPPAQFVATTMSLEESPSWFDAYCATVDAFRRNPHVGYFARFHPSSSFTCWFGVAGAAAVVAVYQTAFPTSIATMGTLNATNEVIFQIQAFFAGYLIVQAYITVFGSGTYTLLYALAAKTEEVDSMRVARPDVYQAIKGLVSRFWFDQAFAA